MMSLIYAHQTQNAKSEFKYHIIFSSDRSSRKANISLSSLSALSFTSFSLSILHQIDRAKNILSYFQEYPAGEKDYPGQGDL